MMPGTLHPTIVWLKMGPEETPQIQPKASRLQQQPTMTRGPATQVPADDRRDEGAVGTKSKDEGTSNTEAGSQWCMKDMKSDEDWPKQSTSTTRREGLDQTPWLTTSLEMHGARQACIGSTARAQRADEDAVP